VLIGEGADEIFGGYEHLEALQSDEELQMELVQGMESGHNGGLQRVDRMTMAHGLEARAPFLDSAMIEIGFSIPAAWKQIDKDQPEKRLLRQAFDGWLPDEFLWRKKAQFGEGSGAVTFLGQQMEASITDEEFERERNAVEPPLRTREELAYYRIFSVHLPNIRAEQTITRFVTA
jgi:asparagine synthase (glutamine-hydrolysing)